MKELVKPIKPIMPDCKDYVKEKLPSSIDTPFVKDYKKYQKEVIKYNADLDVYEQSKLIKFIKNADTKLILKKYRIIKK